MVPGAAGLPLPVERVLSGMETPALPGFTVTHRFHPRFRDTDAMGHINNAVYVTYLEVARQEYWRALASAPDYRRVPFILAHVSIDFRSEALVSEALDLGIRCAWIGGKSFAFDYRIQSAGPIAPGASVGGAAGRAIVEATSVQVCYDYEAKRSLPVPAELRRRMETFEGRTLARESPS
jgi:acyl-CoA thioester hydrolase